MRETKTMCLKSMLMVEVDFAFVIKHERNVKEIHER